MCVGGGVTTFLGRSREIPCTERTCARAFGLGVGGPHRQSTEGRTAGHTVIEGNATRSRWDCDSGSGNDLIGLTAGKLLRKQNGETPTRPSFKLSCAHGSSGSLCSSPPIPPCPSPALTTPPQTLDPGALVCMPQEPTREPTRACSWGSLEAWLEDSRVSKCCENKAGNGENKHKITGGTCFPLDTAQ